MKLARWICLALLVSLSLPVTLFADNLPVPGAYVTTGVIDVATYSTTTFHWKGIHDVGGSVGSFDIQWGAAGDIPVPADYDHDGVTDIAVYRPSTGVWYILQSHCNCLLTRGPII